jgi:hypothetical protein
MRAGEHDAQISAAARAEVGLRPHEIEYRTLGPDWDRK